MLNGNFVVRAWIPQHISDHSAVHYSGQVLLQMLAIKNQSTLFSIFMEAMQQGKRWTELPASWT
jgi:hypothetical protein